MSERNKEIKVRVNEIFFSIDGEGRTTGGLAIFIRLSGCNLRCSYCDTEYALSMKAGKEMTIEEILLEIKKYSTRHVTLTGGEPLLQAHSLDLVKTLVGAGYLLNIETNGAVDIRPAQREGVMITLDYKCPASGMEGKMLPENFKALREEDLVKFVCETSDLPRVKEVVKEYQFSSYVYFSPVFGKIRPEELVEFLKELAAEGIDTEKFRVGLQIHKVIWDPNLRGV